MWRSIAARSSFTRSFVRKFCSFQNPSSQVINKPFNSHYLSVQNPRKFHHQNYRFFSQSSSISEFETENHDAISSEEVEAETIEVFSDTHDDNSSLEPENEDNDETQMSNLNLNDQELEGIDDEIFEKVKILIQSSVDGSLESSLNDLDLRLTEEFVMKLLEIQFVNGDTLNRFFKWVLSRNDFQVTNLVLSEFVCAICNDPGLKRNDLYALWDIIKEFGEKESGFLNANILNQLISALSKMGKGKAALEVFEKFEEFGCVPNVDTYYFTIEALCKRSFFDWATSVCQKMVDSGMIPDSDKVGEIISYYCKDYRAQEAYVVYLAAKKKNIHPPQKAVNFLISCLSKVDETVYVAQEMLVDFSDEVRLHSINPFTWVVRGLCRIKDIEGAKKLFSEMIEKGPLPGNAVFNIIINALSKNGDLEDAKDMVNVMKGRGLKPDVYTYSVIISGYAKGGMMEEACKVLAMAKTEHSKLCPATFHSLIRGYCNLGDFDKALNLMSQMKDYGVEPNVDEYNKLIQSLCLKSLDWKTAERLLKEMKSKGLHLPGITRGLISAVKELEQEVNEQEAIGSEEALSKA
ncbi:unnamed protein product [Amaranthus hypochondriacus]